MVNLVEGLKEGDLEELLIPMISIDEYESKLDDDSIVVAFYVKDRDPSYDLNRFIQKGASAILDTDVSPAPNEDDFYMVFVEFLRDEDFPNKLLNTLGSLRGLTGIQDWKAQIYDQESVIAVTKETISSLVRLVSEEDTLDQVEEDLVEFFKASDLDNMVVEGKRVTLEARGVVVELEYTDQGSLEAVYENNAVMGSATRLDEAANANCRRLQRMLGDLWIAEQRGDYILLSHALREGVALFRL